MPTSLRISTFSGSQIAEFVPDLAKLRIEVFREYPYLYEGSLDYESEYLLSYARTERSVFVIALDGEEVVGVSTGLPMSDADLDFQKPFEAAGLDIGSVFYFGESVLRSEYRGSGVGSRFMRERGSFARALGGFRFCTFCAVQRSGDDPRKPIGYQDLGGFWRKYGFEERPDLETCFSWKEVGTEAERENRMRFWIKQL